MLASQLIGASKTWENDQKQGKGYNLNTNELMSWHDLKYDQSWNNLQFSKGFLLEKQQRIGALGQRGDLTKA